MTLSTLPLSYCTNVHPGRNLAEVERGLDEFTAPLRQNYGAPLAAGLWLAAPVVQELLDAPDRLPRFKAGLERRELNCHTLNAFPYGDFHGQRVKETVYLPDWSDDRRLEYTRRCARVLAALLPEGTEGSISTVPLAFKVAPHAPGHEAACIARLLTLAVELDALHGATGRIVRLAIEPEPFCLLETTAEALAFFDRLWTAADAAGCLPQARQYLGLCYDVCHQAVEFEDVAESIGSLLAAGVRINKVHITCALQLSAPAENPDGRAALARYVEQRYLHQTIARLPSGRLLRSVDLNEDLALRPPAEFLEAEAWRIHFHVPVDSDRVGPLETTRPDLKAALAAVAGLPYAPHLEVETYTWEVLPGAEGSGPPSLVDGLTREMSSTRTLLQELAQTVSR